MTIPYLGYSPSQNPANVNLDVLAPFMIGAAALPAGVTTPTLAQYLANNQVINAKDKGAKGNGSDDGIALQATIDAAAAAGAAVAYLPRQSVSSVYGTSIPLTNTHGIGIVGENENVAIRGIGMAPGQFVLDVGSAPSQALIDVRIENLTLMSDNNGPDLLRMQNVSQSVVKNIILRNGRHGLTLSGTAAYTNMFERLLFQTALSGATVRVTGYTGGGQVSFNHCSFGGGTGFLLDATSIINALSFLDTNFEGCTVNEMSIAGTVLGLSLIVCRTEGGLGTNGFVIAPSGGNVVKGLYVLGGYYSGASQVSCFLLGGGGGTGPRGFVIAAPGTGYSGQFVNLNGDGESGMIVGCQIGTTPAIVNVIRTGVLCINNENDAGKIGSTFWPPLTTPILATGVGHTVDDVITFLQNTHLCKQS